MKVLKLLAAHVYKQKIDNDYFKNPHLLNFFSRMIIPFAFWTELNNSFEKKVGCLGALLLLPALIVMFLPIYFEFVSIKFILLNYWTDWITKFSVIVSLWLIIITFYFYYTTMRQTYFSNKQDGRTKSSANTRLCKNWLTQRNINFLFGYSAFVLSLTL